MRYFKDTENNRVRAGKLFQIKQKDDLYKKEFCRVQGLSVQGCKNGELEMWKLPPQFISTDLENIKRLVGGDK